MTLLQLLDVAVGASFVLYGLFTWSRSPRRVAVLFVATGLTWLAGDVVAVALFWHRGPLVHLLLSYPSGRLRRRSTQMVTATAYLLGASPLISHDDVVTLGLAVLVLGTATRGYLTSRGPERLAARTALVATCSVGLALGAGAGARLVLSVAAEEPASAAYLVAVLAAGVLLFADLRRAPWRQSAIGRLVVELGDLRGPGGIGDKLADTLGDPSLTLLYWLSSEGAYVDEFGNRVELSPVDSGRAITLLESDGNQVGALVHDPSLLHDPVLVDAATSLARLVLANAAMQAGVRDRVVELEDSRRRVVVAGDAARRRLDEQLRQGAELHLSRAAALLCEDEHVIKAVHEQLAASQQTLREFASGIHPRVLTERGLAVALGEVAEASVVPTCLDLGARRLSKDVEAAAYFVCCEALANVGKHARAGSVTVSVHSADGTVVVEVSDDGIGRADVARGSGLRGLSDRVEALGGTLSIRSAPGEGTRVRAVIPDGGEGG